jgi:hypothetical protein
MTGLTPDISIRAAIWSWQMRWMAVALAWHTTSTVAPRRDCPVNCGSAHCAWIAVEAHPPTSSSYSPSNATAAAVHLRFLSQFLCNMMISVKAGHYYCVAGMTQQKRCHRTFERRKPEEIPGHVEGAQIVVKTGAAPLAQNESNLCQLSFWLLREWH